MRRSYTTITTEGPGKDGGSGEYEWELGNSHGEKSGGIHGPDNLLDNSSELQRKHIGDIESAFRCFWCSIAYVSMPITSGKRLYDALTKYGVQTREELDPEVFENEVIERNNTDGRAFALSVKERSEYPPVIPGIFEPKSHRWTDPEYMGLWYRVLEGKAKEIHEIQHWEYSNGGVEEFVRGTEMRFGLSRIEDNEDVKVLDHEGNAISINDGARLISAALVDLKQRGFDVPRLEIALEKLVDIAKDAEKKKAIGDPIPCEEYDLEELVQLKEIALGS